MAVKIISDLSIQKTGHIRVILGGPYVVPTQTATQTQTPTKTPTPTKTQTQTPTKTQTQTPTSTITQTPSQTPTQESCNTSKSGSYSGNDYHVYPNQNLSNNMAEYITFNWSSYDRPNRFTVYDSLGLRWTSGWKGTANYSGPWGMSLNTAQSGFENICFLSTTGRYVVVEAGGASPTTPISDTYDWSIVCLGLCPGASPTPTITPTLTPTNTTTITNTPTATQNSCNLSSNGSYSGNDYHQYPNYNISNSFNLYVSFNWYSYDRPNRFNVYDSTGLIWSSGWKGYATYPGPWGASLSTADNGSQFICFKSTTGRYVLVEAGPANPSSPISDTYDWSMACISPICPSQTPTPSVTATNTATPTLTPSYTPTKTATPTPTNGVKCNQGSSYEGGNSYPTTQVVVLGAGTGLVSLFYNAFDVPDRYIVYFEGVSVIDTGYVGSSDYNIGGNKRANFRSALLGKTDPLTGLQYPNPGTTNAASDGYPFVSSPGYGDASFSKETATTTATVRVYAPMGGTVWEYTLTCPEILSP